MTSAHRETGPAENWTSCDLCGRRIEVGETREVQTIAADEVYEWTNCEHCVAFVVLVDLDPYGDGYDADAVADLEPGSIAEARLIVMQRRKWTRRDGSLWPVPASGVVL